MQRQGHFDVDIISMSNSAVFQFQTWHVFQKVIKLGHGVKLQTIITQKLIIPLLSKPNKKMLYAIHRCEKCRALYVMLRCE